jgi:CheY-like chemotaxis protein
MAACVGPRGDRVLLVALAIGVALASAWFSLPLDGARSSSTARPSRCRPERPAARVRALASLAVLCGDRRRRRGRRRARDRASSASASPRSPSSSRAAVASPVLLSAGCLAAVAQRPRARRARLRSIRRMSAAEAVRHRRHRRRRAAAARAAARPPGRGLAGARDRRRGEERHRGGRAVEQHHPDLVFLDIRMPGMNGIEAARAIAQLPVDEDGARAGGPAAWRGAEIVFITAYDQYAIEAFEQGVVDYVLKPAERERLQVTVDAVRSASPTAAATARPTRAACRAAAEARREDEPGAVPR